MSEPYKFDTRVGEVLHRRLTNALEGYFPDEIAPLMAGDIIDFLNEKYIDKEINAEWGSVDKEARIKYHENQIKILKSDNYHWNRHGNGVESDK